MTSAAWRRSGRALRLAIPVLLGVPLCLAAGWFELTRARAGHLVAWAYVFEWPFFGVAGTYIWWRLLPGHELAGRPGPVPPPVGDASDDLVAWQDYVALLQLLDPPGQPPEPD